ncbi:MAG: TetR/AcrR family transcriptional regulator [Hyphomicrobium sp.]|nr:TetR/AcrR family transcriptional regulator [Hyphomicrobium sp.]
MRVSKEQAAENRERILRAAAALMRERGISGVGVDALTEAAGLTHGSVYSQFGSKDRLAAEALRHALASNVESIGHAQDLTSYVSHYLSAGHRDAPGQGCAIAALGGEMPRSSEAVRRDFTDGVRSMVGRVSALIRAGSKRRRTEEALATVATMVGALMLARAVDDTELADKILQASRKSLIASAR